MTAAGLIVAVQIWGGLGALVALVFLTFGIDRIDPDARGAYAFRPLLVPGIVLLWPLVLWRWLRIARGSDDWVPRYRPARAAHRWIGLVLPAVLFAIVVAGLQARQSWPDHIRPVQLAGPSDPASGTDP